jgi:L-ascorbate metabolism protein UlaG (beta-lactamase superfamily)
LSDAVAELDALLRSHTSGESLEPLYGCVPAPLKGYVELYMDLYHQPSYRLLEALLYRSRHYARGLQSLSFGLLGRTPERPFVLSTPRLPDANHLHVRVPFDADLLDEMFRLRETPASLEDIDRWFGSVPTAGGLSHRELFTSERPRAPLHFAAGYAVRLRCLGHAGFLVETGETTILVDPVIASRNPSSGEDVISFSDLPARIDYVCLTHTHPDHAHLETLLQLRYKIGCVLLPRNNGGTLADPSLDLILRQLRFRVAALEDLEEVPIPGGRIVSVPFLGEHGDLNIRSKTAWLFDVHGRKIIAAADSSNLQPEMYEHIHEIFGELDVLAVGMECVGAPYTWLYGALTTTPVRRNIRESRRLRGSDFEKAAKIVETFRPRNVVIYALGMEPWYRYFMGVNYHADSEQIVESEKMLDYCRARGILAQRIYGNGVMTL